MNTVCMFYKLTLIAVNTKKLYTHKIVLQFKISIGQQGKF